MVKFDDFTKMHLEYFMNKRTNYKFDFIKEEKSNILNYVNKNKVKFKITDYDIPLSKIKKLFDTEWVYTEAINNIDNLDCNLNIKWTYKVEHNIYLKCRKEKLDNIKLRLPILLSMLNYLHDKKNTSEKRPLKIYLILTPLKKILENDKLIGPKNINSGYTDFITNEILCWREEECEKVLFHEMIHYMDLDVRNMAFDDDTLPHEIDGYKSYFEAFTDFWGILYHTIYVSIMINKSVNSLINVEFKFMENQASLMNDFFNLGNWNTKRYVKQFSPAFSYFIIKYLIFKKVLSQNDVSIINKPRELLIEIFQEKFHQVKYVSLPPRMTVIQLL